MPKQVRVVKFIIQPVFLVDDGEHLDELPVDPIAVSARDWEAWAGGGWRTALDGLRQAVEGPDVPAQREGDDQ